MTTVRDRPASVDQEFTSDEMMTVAAARLLTDGTVCLVGIGLPSVAANLARRLHAPRCVLIYESGTIGAKPSSLPLSIGDGELAESADAVVSVPEVFSYWLQAGRIDVGFLGAAQIDRFANINTTVIGPYESPAVRLPGAGGAPEIASGCGQTILVLRQSHRTFIGSLDFITSLGHLTGGQSRARLGLRGTGPTVVITDHGVLEPDPVSRELVLTHLHTGVTVEQAAAATGWALQVAADIGCTLPPSRDELVALRALTAARAAGDGAP